MNGKFISIEGGDGAGKSTQLGIIEDVLKASDIDFIQTREPGGTPVGEALRDMILHRAEYPLSDETELLLMFAARAEHVQQVIKPALQKGLWVVSDRFFDASFAYQGASGVDLDRIQALSNWVLQGFAPDLTLLFDLPLELGLQRVKQRGEQDRFEKESLAYKKRVRSIYRQRAEQEPRRISLIDASQDIAGVSAQVEQLLNTFLSRQQ